MYASPLLSAGPGGAAHDTADGRQCQGHWQHVSAAAIDGSQWFAAHVRSRHEKVVAQQLSAAGICHWLPLIATGREWSDRRVTIHEPLFPGYVFVSIGEGEATSVRKCRGVVQLVGSAGRPVPIDASDIAAVRAAMEGRLRCDPHPYLRVGMEVQVRRGPLMGFRGILVRKSGNCRLILSVRMINQCVAVEIAPADVDPV